MWLLLEISPQPIKAPPSPTPAPKRSPKIRVDGPFLAPVGKSLSGRAPKSSPFASAPIRADFTLVCVWVCRGMGGRVEKPYFDFCCVHERVENVYHGRCTGRKGGRVGICVLMGCFGY